MSLNNAQALPKFSGEAKDWPWFKKKAMGCFISDDEMYELLSPSTKVSAEASGGEEVKEVKKNESLSTSTRSTSTRRGSTPTLEKTLSDAKPQLVKANRKMYALLIGALPESTSKYFIEVTIGDGHGVWKALVAEFERSRPENVVDMLGDVFDLKFIRSEKDLHEDFSSYVAIWHEKFLAIEAARPREGAISQDIKMSALLKGLRQVEEYQSTLDMVRALGCDCARAIELLKEKKTNNKKWLGRKRLWYQRKLREQSSIFGKSITPQGRKHLSYLQ